jgi:uncharacterized protein (TIGR02246 family)
MKKLGLIAVAFSVAACNPAPPSLTEGDTASIRGVSDEFRKNMVAGDWAPLVNLYTEDGVLMPPGGPSVEGRPAIDAFMKAFPKVTEMAFDLEEIDGRGDLAFVRGAYRMTMEIAGAPGPVTDEGKFVEIRRKQADGRWLIAVDIFNSNLPPPAPPTPTAETTGDP